MRGTTGALPLDNEKQAAAMAGVMLAQLPAGDYPYLYELMDKHVLRPGYSYADEFSFGLDLGVFPTEVVNSVA